MHRHHFPRIPTNPARTKAFTNTSWQSVTHARERARTHSLSQCYITYMSHIGLTYMCNILKRTTSQVDMLFI